MSSDNFALAGAITLAALPLACIAFGLLHYIHAKVNEMSLSNPIFVEILDAVKADAAALVSRAEKAESELAAMLSTSASLQSEAEELKAELAAVFATPAQAAEPVAEQPAA